MLNKRGRKRLVSCEYGYNMVLEFFDYDKDKALQWYMTPNPFFGHVTPAQMFKLGRGDKIIDFIETSISENYR